MRPKHFSLVVFLFILLFCVFSKFGETHSKPNLTARSSCMIGAAVGGFAMHLLARASANVSVTSTVGGVVPRSWYFVAAEVPKLPEDRKEHPAAKAGIAGSFSKQAHRFNTWFNSGSGVSIYKTKSMGGIVSSVGGQLLIHEHGARAIYPPGGMDSDGPVNP